MDPHNEIPVLEIHPSAPAEAVSSSVPPLPDTHRKSKWKIVLIVLLTLFIAVISYGYYWYFLNPQTVLSKSIGKTLDLTSSVYTGSVGVEYKSPDSATDALQQPITFSLAMIGNVQQTKDEGFKTEASYTVAAGTVPVSEFDLRNIKGKLYLYIHRLSTFGIADSAKITNNWLEIDLAKLPVRFQALTNIITPDQKQKLIAQFLTKPPVVVSEVLEDETLSGVRTHHYRYTVDKENLRILAIESDQEKLQSYLQNIEFEPGEVWISKDTNTIVRVTGRLKRKGEELDAPIVTVRFDISLRDSVNPVEIGAPPSTILIENAFSEIIPNFQPPQ